MAHGGGKVKDNAKKNKINAIPDLVIVMGGDGKIKSLSGGGHPGQMNDAEFSFDDTVIDFRNYVQDKENYRVVGKFGMCSLTVVTLELMEAKYDLDDPNSPTELRNYVWESMRHWW